MNWLVRLLFAMFFVIALMLSPVACCASGYYSIYYAWLTATPLKEAERNKAVLLHYWSLGTVGVIVLLWLVVMVVVMYKGAQDKASPNGSSEPRPTGPRVVDD